MTGISWHLRSGRATPRARPMAIATIVCRISLHAHLPNVRVAPHLPLLVALREKTVGLRPGEIPTRESVRVNGAWRQRPTTRQRRKVQRLPGCGHDREGLHREGPHTEPLPQRCCGQRHRRHEPAQRRAERQHAPRGHPTAAVHQVRRLRRRRCRRAAEGAAGDGDEAFQLLLWGPDRIGPHGAGLPSPCSHLCGGHRHRHTRTTNEGGTPEATQKP
mmetsp:Transcript_49706/g.160724  ORF Transcript_49706/g.160724 Transcript_49706/m.160724 type:complete len:217 (+) Transcript_49706:1180-1830(+)